MFIFYYAVLSEVTPPTALAPFAAAALTGGNPFRTMMLAWRYTLPAFAVPLVFALSETGRGLLLVGNVLSIMHVLAATALGLAAIAIALGGTLTRRLKGSERVLVAMAGGLLLVPVMWATLLGVALLLAFAVSSLGRRIVSPDEQTGR
jgi:TRAP-type uncharacterized transport system fused permease subunit